VRNRCSAAIENEPVSATATKAFNAANSTIPYSNIKYEKYELELLKKLS
jgi:hypothetical protein